MDTAADGRQGLERLHADRSTSSCSTCSCRLDGYEVLAQHEGGRSLRHVPVMMITALDDIDSAVRCIELGADDYLVKPFDPVLLGRAHQGEPDQEAPARPRAPSTSRSWPGSTASLEARIEEQMAELVRTGELKRFLPQQVAEGLLAGQLIPTRVRAPQADAPVRRHGRVHRPLGQARPRGARGWS